MRVKSIAGICIPFLLAWSCKTLALARNNPTEFQDMGHIQFESELAFQVLGILEIDKLELSSLQNIPNVTFQKHMDLLASLERNFSMPDTSQDLLLAHGIIGALLHRKYNSEERSLAEKAIHDLLRKWGKEEKHICSNEQPRGFSTFYGQVMEELSSVLEILKEMDCIRSILEKLEREENEKYWCMGFQITDFYPVFGELSPEFKKLFLSQTLPIEEKLFAYGKPVPFCKDWKPFDRWTSQALHHVYDAHAVILGREKEALLCLLSFGDELWLFQCGKVHTPWAFSYGPNPSLKLRHALESLIIPNRLEQFGVDDNVRLQQAD